MSQDSNYTLFILGAGANVPYGFPTGEGLKRQICGREFEDYYREIIPHSNDQQKEFYSYDDRLYYFQNDFRKPFCQSPTSSIDLFLSRNPDFQVIGKIGILLCLIESEKKNFNNGIILEKPDWLEFLFNKFTETFIEPDHFTRINNRIRFITFNYDRLLESFLVRSIQNSFNRSKTKIIEVIERIPIEHVYGKIGLLPWESPVTNDANILHYGRSCNFDQIQHLISHLKLIQDRKAMENNHLKEMVRNANRIFFLGFAYAQENLEILGIPNILNDSQRIYGTALNHFPDEIAAIEAKLSNDAAKRKKDNIMIENCDCITLLRKYLPYV